MISDLIVQQQQRQQQQQQLKINIWIYISMTYQIRMIPDSPNNSPGSKNIAEGIHEYEPGTS
jgi:hypothetical protein